MHIFSAIVLILGALIVLVVGLVGVLHDLLERGPYDAPLIKPKGVSWPHRLQGAVLPHMPAAANLHLDGSGGSSAWPGERGNNRM